jgi:hypothetical protein
VTELATIDLWSDSETGKHCRLIVSADGCEVEIGVAGERMLTAWYPSISAAVSCAWERQPPTALDGPASQRLLAAESMGRPHPTPLTPAF